MKRLIGLLLIACLLAGCCCPSFAEPAPTQPQTKEPTQTQPIEETTAPNEPVVEIPERLTFTYTQQDIDEFEQLLEQALELALEGEDVEAVEQMDDLLEEKFEYMLSQTAIANVLHMCDLSDEEASERYLDMFEKATNAQEAYLEMVRQVYLSDSPVVEELFTDWTEEEIQEMLGRTDEHTQLQQQINEIKVEYRTLEAEEMYEGMVPLYIEMVQCYNRLAQLSGYDNYYEYAYAVDYDRDYDPEDVEQLRQLAAQYLLPAYDKSLAVFTDTDNPVGIAEALTLSNLMEGSYETGKEYVDMYLQLLPEEVRQDMSQMFDGNMIAAQSENAREGAFTTDIDEKPFCFFGPGYCDALTLVHEMGHFYGGSFEDLDELPLDLAEVQSQGNEWLFIAAMENELSERSHQLLVDYKTCNDLAVILVSIMVDEFEQKVYTCEDLSSYTAEDFDALMDEVCSRYGGKEYVSTTLADVNQYWRQVVVEQPVYYISYSVSALAAINLFTVAQKDLDEAVNSYLLLTQDVDLEQGFLACLQQAGLSGPFEEEVYLTLYRRYAS